jgi:very-short-patch-repair endonuclease
MMCANRLDIKKELLGQNKISIGMTLQAKVGRYRLDFLLGLRVLDSIKWLVVECDGHDWHDRTKEQAAADRSRDRELQTDGLDVFRFTGSEIWNDSEFCAREVFDWIDAMRAAQ